MLDAKIALIYLGFVFLASIIAIEFDITAGIVEIIAGAILVNTIGTESIPWFEFIATFGGIVLAFLAGSEVDSRTLRSNFKKCSIIGGVAFLLPFVLGFSLAYFIAGWGIEASKIAAVTLAPSSFAVVYVVLVETGIIKTPLGKIIMTSTFISDLLTVIAITFMFSQFNIYTSLFLVASIGIIFFIPKLIRVFFKRYGDRVMEPEIKFLFFIFFVLIFLGIISKSQPILPAFILGFAMADFFAENRTISRKLRTVGFAFITPFFFMKGGMNIDVASLLSNWPVLVAFFLVLVLSKAIGVGSLWRILPSGGKMFTTLLMSTGSITFSTIALLFGYESGYLDKAQFSVLITSVLLSAVVLSVFAQRMFMPKEEIIEKDKAIVV